MFPASWAFLLYQRAPLSPAFHSIDPRHPVEGCTWKQFRTEPRCFPIATLFLKQSDKNERWDGSLRNTPTCHVHYLFALRSGPAFVFGLEREPDLQRWKANWLGGFLTTSHILYIIRHRIHRITDTFKDGVRGWINEFQWNLSVQY